MNLHRIESGATRLDLGFTPPAHIPGNLATAPFDNAQSFVAAASNAWESELTVRRLQTSTDFLDIQHLRQLIRLPEQSRLNPEFFEGEKKETHLVLL